MTSSTTSNTANKAMGRGQGTAGVRPAAASPMQTHASMAVARGNMAQRALMALGSLQALGSMAQQVLLMALAIRNLRGSLKERGGEVGVLWHHSPELMCMRR